MPFLTQGKTNWKYILIVVILAIIVGGGILIYIADFNKKISSMGFTELKLLEKEKSTMKVKLYYYNQIKDREIAEYIPCSPDAVLSVEREIPTTRTPIQDTLKLLMQGNLTEEEKLAGFTTEFPLKEFQLVGANLKDGLLTLEFNDPMNKTGGGSCRVRLLWAQLEKTAKQFPQVREVKFEPEFLFQP